LTVKRAHRCPPSPRRRLHAAPPVPPPGRRPPRRSAARRPHRCKSRTPRRSQTESEHLRRNGGRPGCSTHCQSWEPHLNAAHTRSKGTQSLPVRACTAHAWRHSLHSVVQSSTGHSHPLCWGRPRTDRRPVAEEPEAGEAHGQLRVHARVGWVRRTPDVEVERPGGRGVCRARFDRRPKLCAAKMPPPLFLTPFDPPSLTPFRRIALWSDLQWNPRQACRIGHLVPSWQLLIGTPAACR
jgi:hypothetical protein